MSEPGGSSQDGSFAGGFVPRAGYYQAGLSWAYRARLRHP